MRLKLQKAPIIEAVLDIDCDLPPGQQLSSLEGPARDAYRGRYPKLRTQFHQEHQIEALPDGPPKMFIGRHGVQAFQFVRDDEKQLVQVRLQGFSFNRLAPLGQRAFGGTLRPESDAPFGADADGRRVRRVRL